MNTIELSAKAQLLFSKFQSFINTGPLAVILDRLSRNENN
jgi:hypothetical protein